MNDLNGFVVLLILAMLYPFGSQAQTRSALMVVRGAPSLDCIIKDVFPWGITTSEDISIVFRVVEMIKTPDESLFQEIQQVVKNLRTWKSGEQFVLDFQEAEIQKIGKERFSPISYNVVRMYVATSTVNRLGFQLDFTPWFSKFVAARFEGVIWLS